MSNLKKLLITATVTTITLACFLLVLKVLNSRTKTPGWGKSIIDAKVYCQNQENNLQLKLKNTDQDLYDNVKFPLGYWLDKYQECMDRRLFREQSIYID